MDNIYLILSEPYCKIGIANDVESRLATLQTGNPVELKILACFEFPNASIVEKVLHQKYEGLRIRGEWFRMSSAQVEEFKNLCLALGGIEKEYSIHINDEQLEDAEEVSAFTPTMQDVERIMQTENYRIEFRYNENGLRGIAWRKRDGTKECVLYVGKRNPIFSRVFDLLENAKE